MRTPAKQGRPASFGPPGGPPSARITDTHAAWAGQFGVRQAGLYRNPDGQVYCLLEGPDEDAIRAAAAWTGSAATRPSQP
jgi:hypothetical protein